MCRAEPGRARRSGSTSLRYANDAIPRTARRLLVRLRMVGSRFASRVGLLIGPLLVFACGGSDGAGVGPGDAGQSGAGGAGGQGGSAGFDIGPTMCGSTLCAIGMRCCPGCGAGSGICAYDRCPVVLCATPGDASVGDGAADAASEQCNGITCAASDLCIHPSCGGGELPCEPANDAGQCPQGWTRQLCGSFSGSGEGCVPPPCTPPPPFCAPRPAGCPSSGANCSCLPQDICSHDDRYGGECGIVSDRDVSCVSA
jgi:hypothetical protein